MNLTPGREIREGDTPSGATFSLCRKYRWTLWRMWDFQKPMLLFIGLNPSTAGAHLNDPTVTRMRVRAKRMGFGGLFVCNIFAFRATDPKKMLKAKDPIGPENDRAIYVTAKKAAMVLCGWGRYGCHEDRGPLMIQRLREVDPPLDPQCLGLTLTGHPKHPLYLPYSERPRPIE